MKYYGITDIGLVRKQNQDSILLPQINDAINLYIIADGMGGANAGDIASINAIKIIKEYITQNYTDKNDVEIKQLLMNAIVDANSKIYKMSLENKKYEGMGTTVIVLLIIKNKMFIAHVGDSSLYRIRRGIIRKITKDHTYVQKLVDDKTITKKEAKTHPKRNMLLKSLGCEPVIEPDIIMKKIEEDDYVLMCTDGLTNLVKDKEILLTISSLESCEAVCKKLVEIANSRGGYDNVSIILLNN